MDNRQRVREWILKKSKNSHIKSFKPVAIMKQLNISMKEVSIYCIQMTVEGMLEPLYCYYCDCGNIEVCPEVEDIPQICELCDDEIDLNKVSVEFSFKK